MTVSTVGGFIILRKSTLAANQPIKEVDSFAINHELPNSVTSLGKMKLPSIISKHVSKKVLNKIFFSIKHIQSLFCC